MGQPATLVIDIETVGQDPELIPSRARDILLDACAEEDRLKLLDTLGLDPCTGRIICIGVHWIELDRSRAYCQSDERELLANFWADMGQIRPQRFVTFNGKSFDFPYINIRSAIVGVPIPHDLVLDTRRFSTERHFDVREVLTNYDRYRKGTLEFFCEIFGVFHPKMESTAARSASISSRAGSMKSRTTVLRTAARPESCITGSRITTGKGPERKNKDKTSDQCSIPNAQFGDRRINHLISKKLPLNAN